MHVAETREQAVRDVEYGIEPWFRHFQKVAAFPQMAVEGGDLKEMIDFVRESGVGPPATNRSYELICQRSPARAAA
jgi:limonene 1,2-monooxygenase